MRSKLIFLFTFIAFSILAHSVKAEEINVVSPKDLRKGKTEKPTDTFSDLVKSIRVSEGEWDLFFEKKGGPFNIPPERPDTGAMQQAAKTAYTKKKKLKVSVDPEAEVILSAEIDKSASDEGDSSEGNDSGTAAKKPPEIDYNKLLDDALKSVEINKGK